LALCAWVFELLHANFLAGFSLMRLLLASSEVHPYSKSGGLADMVGALAKALGRAGHAVAVITPLYRGIREKFPKLQWLDYSLKLPLGAEWVQAQVFTLQPSEGVTIYFVDCHRFYDRAGLYNEYQVDYADNAQRFIFFSSVPRTWPVIFHCSPRSSTRTTGKPACSRCWCCTRRPAKVGRTRRGPA
jgi:hypothetical protein